MCFHINCWEFNLLLPLNSRTPLLHSNSWIMVVIFSRFFEFERSQMQWVDWMAIQNHCCDTLSSTHSWFFWHAKRFDILIHSRVLMLCSVCNVWLCVCVCVCWCIFTWKGGDCREQGIIPWNFSQNSLYVTSKQDLCHSQSDLEVASFYTRTCVRVLMFENILQVSYRSMV